MPVGDIDLHCCRMQEALAQSGLGRRHDGCEREPIGGQDARGAPHGIPEEPESAATALSGEEPPVQQQGAQREEQRNAEVPSAGESAEEAPLHREAREEGGMGGHDEPDRNGAHAVQGGIVRGQARPRGRPRSRRVGAHDSAI